MVSIRTLLIALVGMPAFGLADTSPSVSLVDCEINGFGLGDSAQEMLAIFGEPDSMYIAKPPIDDYSHREYRYDGLTIYFSTRGRVAMRYKVSSSEYRLRDGIGIGSTWTEIYEALGVGRVTRSERNEYLSYHVVGADGGYIPATLRFRFVNSAVARFSIVMR